MKALAEEAVNARSQALAIYTDAFLHSIGKHYKKFPHYRRRLLLQSRIRCVN